MIHIDLEKANWLLDQCVKQRGKEYVYKPLDGACMYVDGCTVAWDDETGEIYTEYPEGGSPTPGCMVGLALIKAGVPMRAFSDLRINSFNASRALGRLENRGFLTCTKEARSLFSRVQGRQDKGISWGAALAMEDTSWGQ